LALQCRAQGGARIVASAQTQPEPEKNQKDLLVAIADRLAETQDPAEREKLKEELARLTFGE
jgi:hypothetical protein